MAAKRTGRAPTVVRDRTTHQRPRGKLPHATNSASEVGAHVALGAREGSPAVGWEVDQERRRHRGRGEGV